MTPFLDVRLAPVGGVLATSVAVNEGTSIDDYRSLDVAQLLRSVNGQHVLLGTHGFNVNRADGIASLAHWAGLLQLPSPSIFIGMLWPGDSIWAHGLDYPEEPKIADEAGDLLAPFLDLNLANAASVSFASHSLGARVLLRTVSGMHLPVRRAIIMAGAIDDNCLTGNEFQIAAQGIGKVSVLASQKDEVLSAAFPLGNFVAGIIAEGHPWWRAAIGHRGPSKPFISNFEGPFEIPDNWNFGHGNYLEIDASSPQIALPVDVPSNGSALPANGAQGWQSAWSAAFVSARFR